MVGVEQGRTRLGKPGGVAEKPGEGLTPRVRKKEWDGGRKREPAG